MKKFEIMKMSELELRKRIKDEEENLIHLKFQKATSQLESPIRIRTVRRDIARMKTLLKTIEMKAKPAADLTLNPVSQKSK